MAGVKGKSGRKADSEIEAELLKKLEDMGVLKSSSGVLEAKLKELESLVERAFKAVEEKLNAYQTVLEDIQDSTQNIEETLEVQTQRLDNIEHEIAELGEQLEEGDGLGSSLAQVGKGFLAELGKAQDGTDTTSENGLSGEGVEGEDI